MNGCTISRAPLFVAHHSQRAPYTRDPTRDSSGASSVYRMPRFSTAVLPYRRQVEWSAVRNSSRPMIAATRCPVMTQDAVDFWGAVFFRSGRVRPACFFFIMIFGIIYFLSNFSCYQIHFLKLIDLDLNWVFPNCWYSITQRDRSLINVLTM